VALDTECRRFWLNLEVQETILAFLDRDVASEHVLLDIKPRCSRLPVSDSDADCACFPRNIGATRMELDVPDFEVGCGCCLG
jgi:hypothetical protein